MATLSIPSLSEGKVQLIVERIDTSRIENLLRADLGRKLPHLLAGALYREAEAMMAESKREVPVDTGALRDSGHVRQPEEIGSEIVVELGYGGPGIPYALVQHEKPFRHTVGKWKYLSDPVRRRAADLDQRLAAELAPQAGI